MQNKRSWERIHQSCTSISKRNKLKMHMILVSIFLLIFSQLLVKWLLMIIKSTSNKKIMPPSPRKLPILGNMHQLSSLPHHNLHELAKQHGPIMLLHFGSLPTVIVSSADAAREVMKTHDIIFSNRPDSSLTKRLLYDNKDVSMAQYGEYWRQLKSICVLQLLSNRRVQSFCSIREEETALLTKRIEESCLYSLPVELSEMSTSLTNDVVCRAAFGKKYSEGESGRKFRRMLKEFLEILGTLTIGEFIPCLSWINRVNGFDAKVDKMARDVDEFLEGVVQERLENDPETDRDNTAEGGRRENFVDILLSIYKENTTTGVSIDRDSIKALILDVFAAGTDTSATVLEWAMTELLRHPMIIKKLQNEIGAVSEGKRDITDSDLHKMFYLKCVIKETLRFHPPLPLLVTRVARADAKLMGYDIRAGTMVMINAWTIGRDPSCWDELEKFKPERFLNSSVDFTGHDFHLIPFGAGRRICPAISFAMATIELALANLVHKFNWELPNGAKPEDLETTEHPGVAIRRQFPLLAIAKPRSF